MCIKASNFFYLLIFMYFLGCIYIVNATETYEPKTSFEIPCSFNPVGSGARAIGMSSFLGVADDATATSWTPGGLSNLDFCEISLVLSNTNRKEKNRFNASNYDMNWTDSSSRTEIDLFSIAIPFEVLQKIMALSITKQRFYDLNRTWKFKLNNNDQLNSFDENYWTYAQEGDLSALSISYSIDINSFALGFSLNIWRDSCLTPNKWKQTYYNKRIGLMNGKLLEYSYKKIEQYNFDGVNYNIGLRWNINSNFALGLVYKADFKAKVEHIIKINNKQSQIREEKIKMPKSYGIGLSYRANNNLTISGGIYQTNWNEFAYFNSGGNITNPISGTLLKDSHMKPTKQMRLGFEYFFINNLNYNYNIPIRGGVFIDPIPSEGSSDNVYGISIGFGFNKSKYSIDVAYQHRFANNVGTSYLNHLDYSQDINEGKLYTSLIIYFDDYAPKF